MSWEADHFTLAEFLRSDKARELGDSNQPGPLHLAIITHITAPGMEDVRAVLGNKPLPVMSGYRNPRVNKAVGGVPNSDHAFGFAVDFQVPHMGLKMAGERIIRSDIEFDQLIWEKSRRILHISFNPRLRREVLTQAGKAGTAFQKGLV